MKRGPFLHARHVLHILLFSKTCGWSFKGWFCQFISHCISFQDLRNWYFSNGQEHKLTPEMPGWDYCPCSKMEPVLGFELLFHVVLGQCALPTCEQSCLTDSCPEEFVCSVCLKINFFNSCLDRVFLLGRVVGKSGSESTEFAEPCITDFSLYWQTWHYDGSF